MLQRLAVSFVALMLGLSVTLPLSACGSPSQHDRPEEVASQSCLSEGEQATPRRVQEYDSFSDIPTPFPNLYQHDAESGWLNTYDENRVISYLDAYNYVGQDVTIEGTPSSIVFAGSSSGSPYFINMGDGDFAAIIWSQDLASFDQAELYNYVEWSKSGQPITVTFRISGTVELYDGRPQIVTRDGSQIATSFEGSWMSMMSDNAINSLMQKRYE